MSDSIRWYERRSTDMSSAVLKEVLEKWVKMMSPFIPHITEELWETLGKDNLCSTSSWPKADKKRIDKRLDMMEDVVKRTCDDIKEIVKLVGKKPKEIRIYVSPRWKFSLYEDALKMAGKSDNIIPVLMKSDLGKKMGKDALKFAQAIQKNIGDLKELLKAEDEVKILKDSIPFLKKEYGCDVKVFAPGESDSEKARRADPGKPGIEVI
jgi:leucyl-tRNA synthetase